MGGRGSGLRLFDSYKPPISGFAEGYGVFVAEGASAKHLIHKTARSGSELLVLVDCIGSSLCSKLIPPTFGTSGTGTAVPTVRYIIGLYD